MASFLFFFQKLKIFPDSSTEKNKLSPCIYTEISSLSPPVVLLYVPTLFIEKYRLVSPCCSLEFCISPLIFASLLSSAIYKASRSPLCLLAFCQASVVSSVLSYLNKNLKRWTLKPLAHHSSWTDRVIALRQISVTVPCYSSVLFRK